MNMICLLANPRTTRLFLIAMTMALVTSAVRAATRTWDGDTSPNWSDAVNWDGDATAPSTGDALIFSGTVRQTNTNDLPNDPDLSNLSSLTLSTAGWDIDVGALCDHASWSQGHIFAITANGDSILRSHVKCGNGNRTITLNGIGSTLTVADQLTLHRQGGPMALTLNGAGNTLAAGTLELRTASRITIQGTGNVTVNGPVTDNFSGSLVWASTGTMTLNGTDTYTMPMEINDGTLVLGSGGVFSNGITMAAGATFDVSATNAYTLSTSLVASGAVSAATIRGASSGTVSLGGQPVTLSWGGASSGVVDDRPPLTIGQAELVLSNDPLTIDVPGPALGEGVYTLIDAPGGISGSISSVPVYSGNGQDPALPARVISGVSIIGNSVVLTIAVPPAGTVLVIR